jgi:hypothetical protein
MSLKAFHIVFVAITTATSLFVCGLGFSRYFSPISTIGDLALGLGGLVMAIGLLFYGRYVLKKLQHISYL